MRRWMLMLTMACNKAAPPAPMEAPEPAPAPQETDAAAPETPATTWKLSPVRLDYDGQYLSVDLEVHRMGERDRPAYVGATVIRADGTEDDLAIQTLFPGDTPQVFSMVTQVGPEVDRVVFGLWDHKVEPCADHRTGCAQFGFVLDGPLASWPDGLYTEGSRQRMLPKTLPLTPRWAGMDPDEAEAQLAAFVPRLLSIVQPWGVESIQINPWTFADTPSDALTVLFSDHDDAIRHALQEDDILTGEADATADIRLIFGAPARGPQWQLASVDCAEAEDVLACVRAQPTP